MALLLALYVLPIPAFFAASFWWYPWEPREYRAIGAAAQTLLWPLGLAVWALHDFETADDARRVQENPE